MKSPAKRKVERQLARYERTSVSKKRRLQAQPEFAKEAASNCEESITEYEMLHSPLGDHDDSPSLLSETTSTEEHVHIMTDMTMDSISRLEWECANLREENIRLQSELQVLRKEKFLDSPKKVCYYTGLPSIEILEAVFEFVSPHVPNTRSPTPPFQQFLLVLMKLRLNVDNELLSTFFNIHASTVSRYFQKWIDVMYERLKPVIKWPDREELYKTMPMEFRKNFSRCVVILDCFEVFMERPKGLLARAQTWSNYKHHNTIKFLIGISPQGSITFVSKGWGGRASDQHLTENCGILDHLLPGDIVLADRGFNVQDAAGMYCAEVKLPPFTKGKKQLSRYEIDKARQLSRIRIHVERVIGLLRLKYKILRATLPINLIMCEAEDELSAVDKIVTVCSALCNCCESVVPFD